MRITMLFVSSIALLGTAEARNAKKAAKAPPPPPPVEEAATTESAAEPAPATAAPARTKIIGVDGGLAMPVGTWGDGAGFGIGALARFEMPINEKLTFGARAGYIQHLSKDGPSGVGGGGGASSSAHEIPFLAGVRYGFSKTPTTEVYGAAELGLVVYGVSVDSMGMSQSSSDTNFGMTLTAGYKTGKLDIRGGLLMPDLGHAGDAIGIMATVGYDITTL